MPRRTPDTQEIRNALAILTLVARKRAGKTAWAAAQRIIREVEKWEDISRS